MKSTSPTPETIDEYINSFSKEIQVILNNLRTAIKSAAPNATEKNQLQNSNLLLERKSRAFRCV